MCIVSFQISLHSFDMFVFWTCSCRCKENTIDSILLVLKLCFVNAIVVMCVQNKYNVCKGIVSYEFGRYN